MPPTPRDAFINAACVPLNTDFTTGTLDLARSILAANPHLATQDIHTAAILGDDAAVARFLQADPRSATTKSPPRDWDPLTYLSFSTYLRLDPARSAGFVRAARALLDAGADPNASWYDQTHQPTPERECLLYGAAGLAHNADLTRLLLERGADPNDGEVTYHSPETYDNTALRVLIDTGKLTPASLAIMLVRKADWHDLAGIKLLLAHGADPNHMTGWCITPLHQSIRRDNGIEHIDAMLDHGADPTLTTARGGWTALAIAARRGRGDVLASIERRGLPISLTGVDRLIAACARNDAAAIQAITAREPHLIAELRALGGSLLAQFAGTGNTTGLDRLLDLGIDIRAPYEGDPYFGIPAGSTALHVAAWRARHDTVKFLIARGAPIDTPDANGRTPLALAIRACTDSYWMDRRTPESIQALLHAGASTTGIPIPTGYAEADALLHSNIS